MKRENSNKKSRKIGQGRKLCRGIVSGCRDIISIEPQNSVATKIKLNSSKKRSLLQHLTTLSRHNMREID